MKGIRHHDRRARVGQRRLKVVALATILSLLVSLFPQVVGMPVPTASAHNLNASVVYVYFDPNTQAYLDGLIAGGSRLPGTPLLVGGEELGIILKAVPDEGTTTGVGGYTTFYVPNGLQVIDAAYIMPGDLNADGITGFDKVPMKGQAQMPIVGAGGGPTVNLVGITRGPNILGVTSPIVTAANANLGTLPGVYGDTGIFYSTAPETAFGTYAGSALTNTLKNNSGDQVGLRTILGTTLNKWDAWQMAGYGIAGTTNAAYPAAALIDSNQRGYAPWGLANVVAGPQSGYAWEFDFAKYTNCDPTPTGTPLANCIDTATQDIGPWQRIKYPGSQFSDDPPGGSPNPPYPQPYTRGADASNSGWDFDLNDDGTLDNPLPQTSGQADYTPVAVRWAYGQQTLYQPEYMWIKVKVHNPTAILDATGCPKWTVDTFGGDAGGDSGGKDHIWRYYDPNSVQFNGCLAIGKPATRELVKVGDNYQYKVKLYNAGAKNFSTVAIQDTLPAGVTYISAAPAPTNVSLPNLTWTVAPFLMSQMFEATVTVQAKSAGLLTNTVCATGITDPGGQTVNTCGKDVTVSGNQPLLRQSKSVSPTSVAPGGTVAYTINVLNIGSGPTGSPVVITEYLPAGFTYTGAIPGSLPVTINGASISASVSGTASQPVFTVPSVLNASQGLVIPFNALVASTTNPGSYCNSFRTSQGGINVLTGALACVNVGGAKVGDTVFRDWNGNGVQDAGDEGLSGVTMTLNTGVCLGGAPTQTTVTNAGGNYFFSGLSAGDYCVSVPAPGAGGVPTGYTLTADPNGAPIQNFFTVNLSDSETDLTVDYGYQPGGSGNIGDQVFEDITKDGTFNGSDTGIDGVTVWLYEDTNGDGVIGVGDTKIMTTTTSGGGLYSFASLATGLSYIVDVDQSAPAIQTYFDTKYGGATSYQITTADPQKVTNLTGSYLNADFGFWRAAPGSIGDTVFADVNGDGVYTSTIDTPLANVTVWLYRDTNGDGQPQPAERVMTTTTSVTGTYTFANLGPDDYIVAVDADDPDVPGGYVSGVAHYDITLSPGQNVTYADFPFVPLIQKAVSPTSVAGVPATLSYTITVNYPTQQLLSGVVVTDAIPTGTTYVANSINASGYYTDTPEEGGPPQVVWDIGDNLADVPGYAAGAGKAYCPVILNAPVLADTYLKKESQDKNYGGNTLLITRPATANKYKHILVKFDVSSIPAGAIIQSAYLGMNVQAARATKHNDQVYRMKTAWTEGAGNDDLCTDAGVGGATWNKPNCTGANWAGGDFSSADYDATLLGTIAPKTKGYKTVSVMPAVTAWVGGAANNGLVLLSTGGDDRDAKYYNRENTTANTDPYLKITYLVATTGGCSGPTVLDAIADTYVERGANATKNYGASVTMKTKESGQIDQASLIRFDLGAIPPDATISSAVMTATITNNSDNGQTDTVRVMKSPWAEGTGVGAATGDGATWNTRNGVNTWESGSTFSSSDYFATSLGTITQAGDDLPYTVNATSAITGWLQGGVTNNGLAIIPSNDDGADWVTREATGGDAGKAAKLQVNWTLAANPGAATTTRLKASPMLLGSVGLVRITMEVTASATITNVTPPTNLGFFSGVGGIGAAQASAAKISGPNPATPITITAGSVATFAWVYQLTPTTDVDSAYFTGKPTATNGTFATANSNTVLVVPSLTFKVLATSIPPTGYVTNTAKLLESSVPTDVESNIVTTAFGGTIGNRVWADLNGNGAQDSGEPGVPNVQVCAVPNPAGTPSFCGTTDALGIYGIYGLTNSANYTVTMNLATIPAGYLPTTATSGSYTASTDTADFGIRPPGQATIGDTIWIDANEDGVLDPTESRLPNITVKLLDNANNVLTTTTTDAFGVYTFTGVYAGTYKVQVDTSSVVTSSQGVPSTLLAAMDLVSVAGLTSPLPNPLTVVVPSDTSNVDTADFGFNWGGSIGNFVWWDTNGDGLQTGETGIPDATVLLYYDANGNGEIDPSEWTPLAFMNTDGNGNYLFDNLPPGNYLVDVYEDSITSNGNRNIVPTTQDVIAKTLAGKEDYLAADFGYYKGAKVEGNVFWDENSNGILDASEQNPTHLLSSVAVTLTCAGPDGILNNGDDVTQVKDTDANGHFSFLTNAGACTVSYLTTDPDIPATLGAATTPISYTFTAQAGEDWHPSFDFGVDNSGKIGDLVWFDSNGSGSLNPGEPGLAGVTVLLYDSTGVTLMASTATTATGGYLFPGLADGAYLVKVVTTTLPSGLKQTGDPDVAGTCAGAACDSKSLATITSGNSVLDKDFGYQDTLGSTSAPTITGTVWNDLANLGVKDVGEPGLPGVSVRVVYTPSGGSPITVTLPVNASGMYTVSVPSGANVDIRVIPTTVPPGYSPTTASVLTLTNVTTDQTNQNFGYHLPPASISGTVCAASNGNGICEPGESPIVAVTVTLKYAGTDGILGTLDDQTFVTETLAVSPTYTFPNLQPGLYEIVQTNLVNYTSIADRDGGNPDSITVFSLGVGQNLTGQDFEDAPPPGFAISKVLTAPVSGVAAVSDTITYTIRITNTGVTALTSLAITDTYDSSYITLTSHSIVPDKKTAGIITWTNSLASFLPLQAGNGLTITVDFRADKSTLSAPAGVTTNTVKATAKDQNNLPIGPNTASDDVQIIRPAIGVAKSVAAVKNNGNGTYTVIYDLAVENLGDVPLDSVQVTDNLATTFAGVNGLNVDSVSSTSTPGFAVNGGYDGSPNINLLAATPNQTLAVGQVKTIRLTVTVRPPANPPTYYNQATATGTSPAGPVTDPSDNGVDPDPNGNGNANEAGENDPTPVNFSESPAIGIAKSVAAVQTKSSGVYTVSYMLLVQNLGNVALSNVQVTDNLSATFPLPATFAGASASSSAPPAGFTVNAGYNGTTNLNLLAVGETLAVSQTKSILMTVVVTTPNLGPYFNQAVASGTSPVGTAVGDPSDNGVVPDPDGDGNANEVGENDPTPVKFDESPAIGVAKKVVSTTNHGDGTYTVIYDILVKNLDTVNPLTNVQVKDNLVATFAGATSFAVQGLSAAGSTPNWTPDPTPNFDGSADINMLAAGQSLAPSASATIRITVTVTPGSKLGPYDNQALAEGTSPAGTKVSDLSDDSPTLNPDPDGDKNANEPGENDPTPVTFTETPVIGVAKSVAAITNNNNGSYTVIYDLVVENLGNVVLSNVQVTDTLSATFAPTATFTVNSLTSVGFAVNGSYNGNASSGLLATTPSQTLAIGQVKTIRLTVTATPNNPPSYLGLYNNQATAAGTSPAGAKPTDLSDNGIDPDPNGNSNPKDANEDDPTPVLFSESPAIGVAKSVAAVTGSGPYQVTYNVIVQNLGTVPLSNVQVTDNLSATFTGATSFAVSGVASTAPPVGFIVNGSYNGMTNPNLLAAGQTLAVGQIKSIQVTVNVTPGSNLGPYLNQAIGTGASPAGTVVSDPSDNGVNPDPNGNNNANEPGENDPTPVTFGERPAIGAAKRVVGSPTANPDGSYTVLYEILAKNLGFVALNNVQVTDDLAATFAAAGGFVVQGPLVVTAGGLTANPNYNGGAAPNPDSNLLTSGQTLGYGLSVTIQMTVKVTPAGFLGPYNNQAAATGVSPAGTTVGDLSDDSANLIPDPNNNGNASEPGENDPTPVTFTETPLLGVAKQVVGTPVSNGNGGFTVVYSILVKNYGNVVIKNLQVTDTLATTFPAPATFTVLALASPDFTEKAVGAGGYTGTASNDTLLTGVDTLGLAASGTISFTVVITPNVAITTTYNNTAIGGGVSPAGTPVSDWSQVGTDPDPDNNKNPTDNSDPTPVTLAQNPVLGVAKRVVGNPTNNGNGTFTVLYSLLVQNYGNVRLTNLQVTDDLNLTFGVGKYAVTGLASTEFAENWPSGYNGNTNINLLQGTDTLAVGASGLITATVVVTPGNNLGPYNNQALGSGTPPVGQPISDLSQNGPNPDPDNDKNPGNNSDPTPVLFGENPKVGLAKAVKSYTFNGDGTFTVAYTLTVKNYGDVQINNLRVQDNLDATFGAGKYAVTGLTSAEFAENWPAGYNGGSNTDLLVGSDMLPVNGAGTIIATVVVTPGVTSVTYQNVATVIGVSPGGSAVTDQSQNGTNPDPGTPPDNDPTNNNEPTPVSYVEHPKLGVAKQVVGTPVYNGDSTYDVTYEILVQNLGDVVLRNLQVTDDLAATFAPTATFTALSVTSAKFAVNPVPAGGTYTGNPPAPGINLLAAGNTLAALDQGTITLVVRVNPDGFAGPYNNSATGISVSPGQVTVSDISTNGVDPDPGSGGNTPAENGNAGQYSDPTPVSFETASVGNFVWWDINGNGRQDGEPGIPGVTVLLRNAAGAQIASVETNSSGIYTFTKPAGAYTVQIDPDEFAPGGTLYQWGASPKDQPPDDTGDSDGDLVNHDAAVNLTPGQQNMTVDFGFTIKSELEITKRLMTPDPVRPNKEVSFTIQITNTGKTWITLLPLKDTYNPAYLTYGFGLPNPRFATPDSVSHADTGVIDWTDLTAAPGADLAPGATTSVIVYFTAKDDTSKLTATNGETINTAVVTGAKADPDGPNGLLGSQATLDEQQSSDGVKIFRPTGVSLASFTAVAGAGGIRLAWETASEAEIAGFNVLRARVIDGRQPGDADFAAVNPELIFAEHAGAGRGAQYDYLDGAAAPGTYAYVVEQVGLDGARVRTAPIIVTTAG